MTNSTKKNNIFSILLNLSIIVFLTGCEEKINLDLKTTDPILVVNGMITNEMKAHTVKLSLSTSYFYNQPAPNVSGAIVTITDNEGNLYKLKESSPGIYQTESNVNGKIGNTYTLKIKYNEKEYTSVSTMRRSVSIDSLGYKKTRDDKNYHLLMYAQEPLGKGDYYLWHTYVNNQIKTDTVKNAIFTDDSEVDGNYINGFEMDNIRLNEGDSAFIKTYSITKDAYDFYMSMMFETAWRGGLFDAPPANIKSNISGGAIGLFVASAVTESKHIKIK
ncbi:MAG: DUF4249 domain-containing protein [Bacteroidota bacterium]|nr:DUF4249 domain-containing protein [Bacteroidota bacterium]